MQSVSTHTPAHVLPPDRLRIAVLGRRVRLPDATAALVAELAFGAVHRETTDSLPSAMGRARP